MKKLWLVGLIIAALVVPGALYAQVEVGSGTMQLDGKIKWLYAYQAEDEDAIGFGGTAIETFATVDVELDISGSVGENISYLIELMAGNGFQAAPGNPGELGTIGVRQAKIMISDIIPMTQVTLGTFNLPVSNYQPRATNDYDLIAPPLVNIVPVGLPMARLDSPIGLGWQATGVDFAIMPMDSATLHLVYFNGTVAGGANAETDLEKSWLINLQIMPVEGACISIAYLMEGWQEDLVGIGPSSGTEQQNSAGWVISLGYQSDQLEVNFDWVEMTAADYQFDREGNETDWTWTGYQITAGYWVTDAVEILARYEWLDPNTLNNRRADKRAYVGGVPLNSNYDQLTWLTLGLNYRLNESAEVSVNYIWLTEQGSDIDTGRATLLDDKTPAISPLYQAVDNDLFLVQVQLWQ